MSYDLREKETPEQRKIRREAEWERFSYHDSPGAILSVVFFGLVSLILSKDGQLPFEWVFFGLMMVNLLWNAAFDIWYVLQSQSKINTNYST